MILSEILYMRSETRGCELLAMQLNTFINSNLERGRGGDGDISKLIRSLHFCGDPTRTGPQLRRIRGLEESVSFHSLQL